MITMKSEWMNSSGCETRPLIYLTDEQVASLVIECFEENKEHKIYNSRTKRLKYSQIVEMLQFSGKAPCRGPRIDRRGRMATHRSSA